MLDENNLFDLKILIVDDEITNIKLLERLLEEEGYSNILGISDPEEVPVKFKEYQPDLVLLDLVMPKMDGFQVIEEINKIDVEATTPILMLTALSEKDLQIRALEAGARDFLNKPLDRPLVLKRIKNLLEMRYFHRRILDDNINLEKMVSKRTAELEEANDKLEKLRQQLVSDNNYLREEVSKAFPRVSIVGGSPELKKVLDQIALVAKTDSNILIEGETGTGKELIARNIHEQGSRSQRPLVKVNCGAIPSEIFESEFFGHKRGAFTGALNDRMGRFQQADGGTLFLDEVSELSLDQQAKFLRVLQDGTFEKVGSDETQEVDVRIISATNRNLQEEVHKGNFREDLYFRLSVFPIHVPPLRERGKDIEALSEHILENVCKKLNFKKPILSDENVQKLRNYPWPGNIRELQNVIERAVIISNGHPLQLDISNPIQAPKETSQQKSGILTAEEEKDNMRDNILAALKETNGKIYGPNGAAEMLGLHPQTLSYKIKKLGINYKR